MSQSCGLEWKVQYSLVFPPAAGCMRIVYWGVKSISKILQKQAAASLSCRQYSVVLISAAFDVIIFAVKTIKT